MVGDNMKKKIIFVFGAITFVLVVVAVLNSRYSNKEAGVEYVQTEKEAAEDNKTTEDEVPEKTQEEVEDVQVPGFNIDDDCEEMLWIPSCNILSHIRYGSDMSAIRDEHVGVFECSGDIGVGNYALLGHSNEEKKFVFSGMENTIEVGDDVYVLFEDEYYLFSVCETIIVNPDDVWILEEQDKPMLTIMCCTNHGSQRFVVFCDFVDKYKIDKEI